MIPNIFKRDLDVIRETGAFINRKWDVTATDNFTIKASVHALSSQDVELFPEGFRDQMGYVLYTNTELKTSIPGIKNPDIVKIDNSKYQVVRVEHWGNTILAHYRAVVFKVNDGKV